MMITLDEFWKLYQAKKLEFNDDFLKSRSQPHSDPKKPYVKNIDYGIYYRPDFPKSIKMMKCRYIFHSLLPLIKKNVPIDWQTIINSKKNLFPLISYKQKSLLLLEGKLLEYQENQWKNYWLHSLNLLCHCISAKSFFKNVVQFPSFEEYVQHLISSMIIRHIQLGWTHTGEKKVFSEYELTLIKKYGIIENVEDIRTDLFIARWHTPTQAKKYLKKHLTAKDKDSYVNLIQQLK